MPRPLELCALLLSGSVVWAQTPPPTYDYVKNGVQSAKVDNSTGVPRLMINGQPVPPLLFFYNTEGVSGLQFLAPQMQEAAAAGIHIYSFGFDSWPWDPGSTGNPADFSASDHEMDQLLKSDPQAVFLLRIAVEPPANWSGYANYAQWSKTEDNQYSDGTSAPVSVASNVYFQGFIAAVTLMIQHYESSSYASHILGYHICGQNTGEWFPRSYRDKGLDYSAASLTAFRSWLQQKYGTDQALSNAWGSSVTIASASIPVSAPGRFPLHAAAQGDPVQEFYSLPTDQNWVDYSDYISDEISSRVLAIAHTVRTATAGKRLIAFFHGYIYDLPGSMTGHLRMNQILASPDIDMLAAPISYDDRLAGGSGASMSARDSAALHGKLWMNEDDLFTNLCSNLPDPASNGFPTTSFFETYNVLLRNLASTMIHRGGTWWMDLNATGCFNDPNLWSMMSTYGLPLYNEIYAKPTPYRPDVALITDDRSVIYQKSDVDFMQYPRTWLRDAIAKTGASIGYYDLSDFISGLLPPAKVYIFVNAFSLSDSQIAAIRARLKNEGATAIWQYAPGYLGPAGPDVSRSQTLTGIQLAVASGYSGSTGDGALKNITWGWAWGTFWVTLNPRLVVTDPNVTRLGHYWSDNAVSTASKQVNGFTSVFAGDVALNTQMLTQLLTTAGVHIWTGSNDVIHTDGAYLVVHAGAAGQQKISLPAGVAASNLSGTLLATYPQPLSTTFSQVGETQWFRLSVAVPPVLQVSKTHAGIFSQGQAGAAYTVTVSNAAPAGPTNDVVTVTETLPSGMTLVSMSGTGWTCPGNTCTRADLLVGGASYPAITVTVNVASNAASPLNNQVSVSGGGSAAANAVDQTTIVSNRVVSGKATVSGVGLGGVTIIVSGSQSLTTTTDAFGNYSVALGNAGTYTLTPVRSGYSFSAPVTFFNLVANQTANFTAMAVTGLDFFPVTPCRVADTRAGTGFSGQFGPPAMAGGSTRAFNILSSPCAAGIPANVAAYSLNFTVVPPSGGPAANLTTWPAGLSAMPNVSTLNYAGSVVANAAIVPAGINGVIDVYVNYPTDVLFDINGYFAPPAPSGLAFYPVTPCRIADTRAGTGFSGQFGPPSMGGGMTRTFNLPASACGIPTTASAYSLNFTVVPPAGGPPANLTTWPATQPGMPNVSTLNYSGAVVANAAIVPAGTNKSINVFVNYPTNVLFDTNGYFAPELPPSPFGPPVLHLYPVTPCRIADTRNGGGFSGQFGPPSMAGGTTRAFAILASSCGIPANASAYSLNFTVVPPAGGPAANLTTWPAGATAMPNVSTLNYYGSVVANAAIVPAGPSGAINVYVSFPTDVLFDINGYFAP